MDTHRLSYEEIVERFKHTKNRRVAWNYKNKARKRYPIKYNEKDFVRPVENMKFVPHNRRSYKDLVRMFAEAKYSTTRTSIKNSAQKLYPKIYRREDFPYRTWMSYRDTVNRYLELIVKENATHNELRMANHFKKAAARRYPSQYKEKDFPSRWSIRFSYRDIVSRYTKLLWTKQLTKSEISQLYSMRKRAEERFPDKFNVVDFPARKDIKDEIDNQPIK